MSQLEKAASRRQQVLDFLWENPGANMDDICPPIQGDDSNRNRYRKTVRTMLAMREIRSEGDTRLRRYWAMVKTTRQAETVKQLVAANVAVSNRERVASAKRIEAAILGRYIHDPGSNKHGMPGRGGQGALRQTVYAGCYSEG